MNRHRQKKKHTLEILSSSYFSDKMSIFFRLLRTYEFVLNSISFLALLLLAVAAQSRSEIEFLQSRPIFVCFPCIFMLGCMYFHDSFRCIFILGFMYFHDSFLYFHDSFYLQKNHQRTGGGEWLQSGVIEEIERNLRTLESD